jgi:Tfp pilus assembly protein PilE
MGKKKTRRGFTLAEIMIISFIVGLIATGGYRVLSGVFVHFGKSQAKLTNLRMANVVIEWFKSDIRASVIPGKDEEPVVEKDKCSFYMSDISNNGQRERVEYVFKDNLVTREIGGVKRSLTGEVKITDLKFEEVKDEDTGGRFLRISIVVDKDKDLEERSVSNIKNVVELATVLYPKFYDECLTVEEQYWNNARRESVSGS